MKEWDKLQYEKEIKELNWQIRRLKEQVEVMKHRLAEEKAMIFMLESQVRSLACPEDYE
ncbi:MAG: hypothetical protein GTN76_03710 [Candidatus Aenigmarchaeota archaeon]|nr:hypothetical protein [Candidatus Aenigmarchaeota archaeon]